MATLGHKYEGTWPKLTDEELANELPHGGVRWGKMIELSDEAREKVAAAISKTPPVSNKIKSKAVWWDSFNSGSTYKPQ